jgi:hypothetical protein
MDDGGGSLWLISTVGGVILLGLALAYASFRGRGVTPAQKEAGERGAQKVYAEEQRAPEN